MATAEVPQYHELLWPALQAVAELGGSASISEIVENRDQACGLQRCPASSAAQRRAGDGDRLPASVGAHAPQRNGTAHQ